MKATQKNLFVLTRLEERMRDAAGRGCDHDRFNGHPALTVYNLRPGERYHAERLVKMGLLAKVRSRAPWFGRQGVTLYYAEGRNAQHDSR